jgi:hypothetical protein
MTGPSLAWDGGNRILLVYARFEPNSEGVIRMLLTTDRGQTWTATNTAFRTSRRPAVAWNAARSQWYVVFTQGAGPVPVPWAPDTPCTECGEIRVFATANGVTTSSTAWNPPASRFSWAGPGIACRDAGTDAGKCWIVYPDADVAPHALRQMVIDTASSLENPVVGETNTSPFSAWSGRWITSQDDVAAVYDGSRTDLVYTFREPNSGLSLVATWLDASDTVIPPGFSSTATSPVNPGFNSGGEALGGILTGVGVTVDRSVSPWAILAIAHK